MDAGNCIVQHSPVTIFRLFKAIGRTKHARNPTVESVIERRYRYLPFQSYICN